MKTEITHSSDVERQFEVIATFEDMAGDIDKAIRTQRMRTTMKGFRPGKVPVQLVKKIYGKALSYGVAEDLVQRTFQEEVLHNDAFDIMGQPTISELEFDYEAQGDLRAVVTFGVRPVFELEDISRVTLHRLEHEVTEDDIRKEIDVLRAGQADIIPDEGPSTAESYVVVDLERLEEGELVDGTRQADVPFLLSDENLMPQLKEALTGVSAGDETTVTFPGQDGEDRTYAITVKEIKRRELPELTDELVAEITDGKVDTVSGLEEEVRTQLEEGWKKRSRELFEGDVIDTLCELHPFQIPASVVEMYQDAYVEELKKRGNDDKLPEGFDVEGYKASRRDEAELQARWMFIRDCIIESEGIEVTEDDMEKHYEEMAEGAGFPVDMLKKYYGSMPQMLQNVRERMLSDKVFAWITDRTTVIDADVEEYQKAAAEKS
ncbi:MAG: trigger factor [Bacteroidetes bacterium CG12_big_fil_rev_8_21_14_0_65_60_17]|nr:MAG: trigger factor [Bacteroidetes bacterium CG12_big_fil_rev_8_21_14_0_65_60_17]